MCAVFLGDLCVFVCVCAQEALNTRSWSRARAFKAAREAGDPGPATAETASGHLLQGERNHDQATCRLPIWMSTLRVGNRSSALLLGGSRDTEQQQPHICQAPLQQL